MKIGFPGYRRFDAARVDANKSMVALLIGTRLAAHTLDAHDGSEVRLPEMYPAVQGVDLLNLKVVDAQAVLLGSEQHLASMAIPFVQSVYEVLVDDAMGLLQRDGKPKPTRTDRRGLMNRHRYLERVTGVGFDPHHLELIDFTRRLRNCIVHDGAAVSVEVTTAWSSLTAGAAAEWSKLANRPFNTVGDGTGRQLTEAGELVAVLAITKRLSREICAQLAASLSSTTWAEVVLDDFDVEHPRGLSPRPTLLREVRGFARQHYLNASVAEADLAGEIARRGL